MSSSLAKPVNLRVRDEVRALIDRAARAQGRSRSDFMIEAARRAAEDVLIDQSLIRVDGDTYDAFLAALDAPPQVNAALAKTMNGAAPWDSVQ